MITNIFAHLVFYDSLLHHVRILDRSLFAHQVSDFGELAAIVDQSISQEAAAIEHTGRPLSLLFRLEYSHVIMNAVLSRSQRHLLPS